MPKLFNLKKDGKLNLQIFNGSLLLVEFWLSIIKWAVNGGMDFLKQKTQENYESENLDRFFS